MKSEQWKTYRTRFLVQAKQLQTSLAFVDHLGRQHSGRKGDYLVESSDGVLSIAPRRIFEDIYVPMASDLAGTEHTDSPSDIKLDHVAFEPLRIQQVKIEDGKIPNPKDPNLQVRDVRLHDGKIPPVRSKSSTVRGRKQPQPVRDRQPSPSHLRLM